MLPLTVGASILSLLLVATLYVSSLSMSVKWLDKSIVVLAASSKTETSSIGGLSSGGSSTEATLTAKVGGGLTLRSCGNSNLAIAMLILAQL